MGNKVETSTLGGVVWSCGFLALLRFFFLFFFFFLSVTASVSPSPWPFGT